MERRVFLLVPSNGKGFVVAIPEEFGLQDS